MGRRLFVRGWGALKGWWVGRPPAVHVRLVIEATLCIGLGSMIVLGHPELVALLELAKRFPTALVIALVGACGLVGAQLVTGLFNLGISRRNAAKLDQVGVTAQKIMVSADGTLTAARTEIAALRGELSRIYPGNVRVAQQAEDAKTDLAITAAPGQSPEIPTREWAGEPNGETKPNGGK